MKKDNVNDKGQNRLIYEKSPYLLQHAENPVMWHPWGEEAFQKAKEEDKPIFLSIGYATCHWCHIMAHESFEDEEVARILNKDYISIKVDREERPDIDNVYMLVCQVLTGRGGWPLTIVMTPDGKPFFAATYIPKNGRMGMSGLIELLTKVVDLWRNDRGRILESSEKITEAIQSKSEAMDDSDIPGTEILHRAYEEFNGIFDSIRGGFGDAPKFPTPHQLSFLLRWSNRSNNSNALDMVEKTLVSMRNGGIFDQIGYGIHRYSVDNKWLVPHFEKMLYDQALLSIACVEAYLRSGKGTYAGIAEDIFKYVLRDMISPEGGFYSAEDADSEGKEGTFYLWTPDEVKKSIGNEIGEIFCRFYDITQEGNFEEGKSILHIPVDHHTFAERNGMSLNELQMILDEARDRLFEVRETRIHPLKDDKILTAWNGLMIAALSKGYKAFGNIGYAEYARNAADFILQNLRDPKGFLYRRYREGEKAFSGYLNDYAFLVWGLLELYEATFEVNYLEEAILINKVMIDEFRDNTGGGFYFTGRSNEALIAQFKDPYDGALPSGNSVSALNLLRISRITGDLEYEKMADQLIKAFSKQINANPIAYTQLLLALDFILGPCQEIVISGNPSQSTTNMIEIVREKFLPNSTVLLKDMSYDNSPLEAVSPYIKEMRSIEDKPTVYLCSGNACESPITDEDSLRAAIADLLN